MAAAVVSAAHAGDGIFLRKLANDSSFKEKGDWQISTELTKDLKKALVNRGFSVYEYKEGQDTAGKTVLQGRIADFGMNQQEFDSLPAFSYKTYEAKLGIYLTLLGPATGWATELRSEYTESSKRLRSILPGADEAEKANDKILDFETREEVKWGSAEFRKSVAGVVADKVMNDLSLQVLTIIKSRPTVK
jgi:hypothetical protein